MAKIQIFQGIVVYDHEEKRFWKSKEIKELALEFWKNLEMDKIELDKNDLFYEDDLKRYKNPSNGDLAFIFREEFNAFLDMNNPKIIGYWDDLGRWEILEAPINIGFGIIEENSRKRIMELKNG